MQKAMRLDPNHPEIYLVQVGAAYNAMGRYREAADAFRRAQATIPVTHLGLAYAYLELGREQDARAEAAEVLRLNPQFNLETVFRTVGPKGNVLARRWSADLRKAGLN